MNKSRQRLFTLLLLGFSVGISLLIGEVVVRVFAPQELIPLYITNDPELAFHGIPDCSYHEERFPQFFTYQVDLNNHGFRMPVDISAEKDKPRVLAVGDSFTFGWGVEQAESFLAKIQATDPQRLYLNAGFPAYGTGHVIKTVARHAQALEVDEVIYFLYFNDIFDNSRFHLNYRTHEWVAQGQDSILQPVTVYSPLKRAVHKLGITAWLYKRSHLAVLVKKTIRPTRKDDPDGLRNTLTMQAPSTAESDVMIARTLDYLELLEQTCQASAIPLKVVYIPCWEELPLDNDVDWTNGFPFAKFKTAVTAAQQRQRLSFELWQGT
ncbi:MAG: SGNH/GDSL hydrolase family protein [Bacteroidota bacterium]